MCVNIQYNTAFLIRHLDWCVLILSISVLFLQDIRLVSVNIEYNTAILIRHCVCVNIEYNTAILIRHLDW